MKFDSFIYNINFCLSRVFNARSEIKPNLCRSIFISLKYMEYLIDHEKNKNINTFQLNNELKKYTKKCNDTIKKMGGGRFWNEVKKDLEFNFKILLGTHPRGFGSLSLDKDELATILDRRNTAEIAIHFFPREYGNFDDRKEALAIWDKELRERADMLRYDEEYKSYYMGPFWLPKEQYWWNFIWDVECE